MEVVVCLALLLLQAEAMPQSRNFQTNSYQEGETHVWQNGRTSPQEPVVRTIADVTGESYRSMQLPHTPKTTTTLSRLTEFHPSELDDLSIRDPPFTSRPLYVSHSSTPALRENQNNRGASSVSRSPSYPTNHHFNKVTPTRLRDSTSESGIVNQNSGHSSSPEPPTVRSVHHGVESDTHRPRVTAAPQGGSQTTRRSADPVGSGFVFPGPHESGHRQPGRFAPRFGKTGPNCASGGTFCEATDSYPSDYLNSILKAEGKMFKELFGNDIVNDSSLSQRIDARDESPLCPSVEQVVYPKMAQNKDEKWLFVVNQDEYIQGVRVEKCLKEDSCSTIASFPLTYKTSCRQKYIYRRMLALNEEGKTYSDAFRLPSCCACFVKMDGAARDSG